MAGDAHTRRAAGRTADQLSSGKDVVDEDTAHSTEGSHCLEPVRVASLFSCSLCNLRQQAYCSPFAGSLDLRSPSAHTLKLQPVRGQVYGSLPPASTRTSKSSNPVWTFFPSSNPRGLSTRKTNFLTFEVSPGFSRLSLSNRERSHIAPG